MCVCTLPLILVQVYYIFHSTEYVYMYINIFFFFAVALRPNAGHGVLILEVFWITHNDAPQSVGLLWTSDELVAETST